MREKKIDLSVLLIGYSILVLCFFIGVSPLMHFVIPDDNTKTVIIGSAIATLFTYMLIKNILLKKNVILCVCAVVTLVAFSVVNSAWTQYYICLFALSAALCILSINEKQFLNFIEAAFYIILVMDIFYAVVTIFCFFNGEFYKEHIVPLFPWAVERLLKQYESGGIAGLTSHYSTNAMLLSGGLLISISLFTNKRQKRYLPIIGLMTVALLLTGKRAHILFSVAAIFVLYFFSLAKQGISKMLTNTLKMVVVVIIISAILFLIVPELATFLVRFKERLEAGDISFGRFRFWFLAWDAFKENFLFGVGWKHYRIDVKPGYDVHNVYIQLFCEIGIIGGIVYCLWFGILYFQTIKTYVQMICREKENYSKEKYLLGFSLTYQTFFFLYCFTGNPLYEIYTFVPYFISCGITIFCWKKMKSTGTIANN